MKMYQFFVIARDRDGHWRPVAGPFPNKPTAQEAREAYDDTHLDYRSRTRVVSRTKLTTVYGYRVGAAGDADIAEKIERTQEAT